MEIQVLALSMDIFFILTLHVLYKQLLGERFKNRIWLVVGWMGCLAAWNLCSYLSNENPLINGIYTIIINFFIMHLLYKGNIRSKVILVFVVVALGFVSEIMAGFMMQLLPGKTESGTIEYMYIGSANSKIFWFIFVKIIAAISRKNKQIKIALTEWVEVFAVPIGSLIIFYVVAWKDHFDITGTKLIVFMVLLVINLLTYYIYQKLQEQAEEVVNSRLLMQQNAYYKARYEDVEKQWAVIKKIRHDMKNSYVLELSYLENEKYEELHDLYTKAIGELKSQNRVIDTGNIGIDSIVNYKVEMARECGITVKQDVKIRSNIQINNGDLNVVLGNLFDNAIEAVSKQKEEKLISFRLYSDETALLFSIENGYKEKIQRNEKDEIVTRKNDKENHGIGLSAVKEVVKRYNGNTDIEVTDAMFKVTVFMYMSK